MKNDLLSVNLEKSLDMDERLPAYNDFLELMVLNKIQRGDFDDIAEQMTAALSPDCCDYLSDDDCDHCEEERDAESAISERLTGCTESCSRKLLSAGYTDCMDEAIRFLVEEEKISPEHPVVRNLKAHLEQSKERVLKTVSDEVDFEPSDPDCLSRLSFLDSVSYREFFASSKCAWNTG